MLVVMCDLLLSLILVSIWPILSWCINVSHDYHILIISFSNPSDFHFTHFSAVLLAHQICSRLYAPHNISVEQKISTHISCSSFTQQATEPLSASRGISLTTKFGQTTECTEIRLLSNFTEVLRNLASIFSLNALQPFHGAHQLSQGISLLFLKSWGPHNKMSRG